MRCNKGHFYVILGSICGYKRKVCIIKNNKLIHKCECIHSEKENYCRNKIILHEKHLFGRLNFNKLLHIWIHRKTLFLVKKFQPSKLKIFV